MEHEGFDPDRVASISRSLVDDWRRKGVDGHLAEDVVQEAWLRTLRRRRSAPERVSAWLRVVGTRILSEFGRKRRTDRDHERQAARQERIFDAPPRAESRLLRLIEELPESCALVVRLRFFEDLEIDEIARLLRCPEATVRSRLKRGLDRLRQRLHPEPTRRSRVLAPLGWLLRLAAPRARLLAGLSAVALLWGTLPRSERAEPELPAEPAVASVRPDSPRGGEALTGREPLPSSPPAVAAPPAPELAATAVGFVRTPEGRPLPGAEILRGDSWGPRAEPVATSDADGRFEAAGIGLADFLWATHPDYLSSGRAHAASAREGEPLELVLERAAGRLELSLRDALGSPLALAPVELEWSLDERNTILISAAGVPRLPCRSLSARTDALGRVSLPNPGAGPARLRVSPPGRPSLTSRLELPPGGLERELVFAEPPALVGQVVDERGHPAPHARVELLADEGSSLRTEADALGRFRFAGLEPGPCRLQALQDPAYGTGSGSARVRIEERTGPGEADEVRIELLAGRAIVGRARLGGAPLTGARVERIDRGGPSSELTDAEGRFAFPACASGEHTLALYLPGCEWPTCLRRGVEPGPVELELVAGEEPPPVELVLEFEAPEAELVPSLVELRAKELRRSQVRQVDRARRRCEFLLPQGFEVEFAAWTPGFGRWTVEGVELPGPRLQSVEVPSPCTIQLRVGRSVASTGSPLAGRLRINGFLSSLLDHRRGVLTLRELAPSPDGALYAARIMPGPCSYSFSDTETPEPGQMGFVSRPRQLPLSAGGAVAETVRIEPALPVEIRVPLQEDECAPNLWLLTADGGRSLLSVALRKEGGLVTGSALLPLDTVGIEAVSERRSGTASVTLGGSGPLTLVEIHLNEPEGWAVTRQSGPLFRTWQPRNR